MFALLFIAVEYSSSCIPDTVYVVLYVVLSIVVAVILYSPFILTKYEFGSLYNSSNERFPIETDVEATFPFDNPIVKTLEFVSFSSTATTISGVIIPSIVTFTLAVFPFCISPVNVYVPFSSILNHALFPIVIP